MRALEASRAVFGLCQVVFPAPIYRVVVGQQPDARVRAVMRILGARHLIQAVAVGAVPTSGAVRVGAGVVDSLHSVSMIVLAIADRRRRRAAALDAVIAGCSQAWNSRSPDGEKEALPPRGDVGADDAVLIESHGIRTGFVVQEQFCGIKAAA